MMFDLEKFIMEKVIKRNTSFFQKDIEAHAEVLNKRIRGKSVLVIGGAGTIGTSFIKAVLRFAPHRLYIVDINENGLTELTRDLRSSDEITVPGDYKTYPIDFSNPIFEKILYKEGPFEIIANFAAHKHVRSEKDQYSVEAMIDNNVFKAKQLLDQLLSHPPERFFCVSTDKAANPVNVMGASKKLMEEVIMSYVYKIPVTTARFANVAFSNGSLLFGYLERMLKKQPLSCPRDVKRYFVSPQESGEICMLACMLGNPGDIFFPKFEPGQLTSFKDITEEFVPAFGYKIDECSSESEAKTKATRIGKDGENYPVYFFNSDTSGEKLFEEFYTDDDLVDLQKYDGLGVIKHTNSNARLDIDLMINKLRTVFNQSEYHKQDIIEIMQMFIPNFDHVETGKNLDQKM